MSDTLRLSIGHTLVDITKTDEVSGMVNSMERNQQRNWETLVQVLGLRAQLITLTIPTKKVIDIAGMPFGDQFKGKHAVWSFTFGVEQEAVFSSATRPHGTLESDFVNVPIIMGLSETALMQVPTFAVSGSYCNIYFEPLNL